MLKELTVKEALRKLYEEGEFDGYVRNHYSEKWIKAVVTGVDLDENENQPFSTKELIYSHCAIEVKEEDGRRYENKKFFSLTITETMFSKELPCSHCSIKIPEEYEPYPYNVSNGLNPSDVVIYKKTGLRCEVGQIDNMPGYMETAIRVEPFSGRYFKNHELFNLFTKQDGSPIGRLKGSEK